MTRVELVRKVDPTARYREMHHAIAKYMAGGMTDTVICNATGVSERILIRLRRDPTFQELIAVYAERITDNTIDFYRQAGMGSMMLAEWETYERLNDEDYRREIPLMQLNRISQDRADRFGYGKHQVIHHDSRFGERLDRAIERSSNVIEVKPAQRDRAEGPPQLPAPPVVTVEQGHSAQEERRLPARRPESTAAPPSIRRKV